MQRHQTTMKPGLTHKRRMSKEGGYCGLSLPPIPALHVLLNVPNSIEMSRTYAQAPGTWSIPGFPPKLWISGPSFPSSQPLLNCQVTGHTLKIQIVLAYLIPISKETRRVPRLVT